MFQPTSSSLLATSANSDGKRNIKKNNVNLINFLHFFSVTDRLIRLEALTEKQNHRLGFLELKTQDQETKIQVLETKIEDLLEENDSPDDEIVKIEINLINFIFI